MFLVTTITVLVVIPENHIKLYSNKACFVLIPPAGRRLEAKGKLKLIFF